MGGDHNRSWTLTISEELPIRRRLEILNLKSPGREFALAPGASLQ